MDAIIYTVDHIIRADMDAMRAGAEQALTPGAQEVAIAIKDNHRVLAAVEDVHVVLGVHRDASHVDELQPDGSFSQFSTGVKSSMPLPTTVAIMCLLMSEKSEQCRTTTAS